MTAAAKQKLTQMVLKIFFNFIVSVCENILATP